MIYLELFLSFFLIGAVTFGGGYAMLPMIQETVADKGWMELSALVDFIAVSESTPGPFAVNIATYIGSQVGGVLGSLCATLGVVMPSFIIILIVARCYMAFKNSKIVKGIMTGLKPAVVGLIGAAVLSIASTVFIPSGFSFAIFADPITYVSAFIFVLCLVLVLKKVHPILLVCLSAALGIAAGYIFL